MLVKQVNINVKTGVETEEMVEYNISQNDLFNNEINKLKLWFNTYYTVHEQQYRRLHTLGDSSAYNKLIELYKEAEIKRARIQELERLLSENSK